MKLLAPKSFQAYSDVTEHAVKHLYSGLNSCWIYYEQALEHWDITQAGQPMTPEKKEALNKYLELSKKYFDLKFSEAMFAGGILQIAFMAIELYSVNETIPDSCTNLVRSTQKTAIPFCIGPQCHGIPTGLIVYAGRNQYCHWDEAEPHEITRKVFRALTNAFRNNILGDLAFSLSNPTINVYANEVLLRALVWTSYNTYLKEMESMLP
jgi:hypothetical protein